MRKTAEPRSAPHRRPEPLYVAWAAGLWQNLESHSGGREMRKRKGSASQAAMLEAADEAKRATELAAVNIRRYLRAQQAAATQVIILAPELVEAARATALSAELAAVNINRYLRLQKENASQVTPVKPKKKG